MKKKSTTFRRLSLLQKNLRGGWRQYRKNKMGILGMALLSIFIFIVIFAPYLTPHPPYKFYVGEPLAPPSKGFILGTDELGRCILSELIYGSRISMLVGIAASLIIIGIGTIIGLLAGYYGGILNDVLMRLTDTFIMIPSLALMIVFAAILGASIYNIILAIGITSWPGTARMVMSQTLSVKERPYVEAARAIGSSDFHIISHYILLNVFPLVFTNAILSIASAVLFESGLSFLGLGDPSHLSWGMMLYYANNCGAIIIGAWWYLIPPGLCIMLLVLSFTFISHGLDEILNPRLRAR